MSCTVKHSSLFISSFSNCINEILKGQLLIAKRRRWKKKNKKKAPNIVSMWIFSENSIVLVLL